MLPIIAALITLPLQALAVHDVQKKSAGLSVTRTEAASDLENGDVASSKIKIVSHDTILRATGRQMEEEFDAKNSIEHFVDTMFSRKSLIVDEENVDADMLEGDTFANKEAEAKATLIESIKAKTLADVKVHIAKSLRESMSKAVGTDGVLVNAELKRDARPCSEGYYLHHVFGHFGLRKAGYVCRPCHAECASCFGPDLLGCVERRARFSSLQEKTQNNAALALVNFMEVAMEEFYNETSADDNSKLQAALGGDAGACTPGCDCVFGHGWCREASHPLPGLPQVGQCSYGA